MASSSSSRCFSSSTSFSPRPIPLFGEATAEKLGTFSIGPARAEVRARAVAVGVDEYQKYLYEVHPDAPSPESRLLPARGRRPPSGVSHRRPRGGHGYRIHPQPRGRLRCGGASDGRVALLQVRFRPVFEGQTLQDQTIEVRDREVVTVDPEGRPVRDASYTESLDGARSAGGARGSPGDRPCAIRRGWDAERRDLFGPRKATTSPTLRLGRASELLAATVSGRIYQWEVSEARARLLEATKVSDAPITAIEYGLGGNTVIVGDENGALAAWFRARPSTGCRHEARQSTRVRISALSHRGHRLLHARA